MRSDIYKSSIQTQEQSDATVYAKLCERSTLLHDRGNDIYFSDRRLNMRTTKTRGRFNGSPLFRRHGHACRCWPYVNWVTASKYLVSRGNRPAVTRAASNFDRRLCIISLRISIVINGVNHHVFRLEWKKIKI